MVRKAIGHAPLALGRALVKSKIHTRIEAKRQGRKATAHMHNVEEDDSAEQQNLKSVMERNAMDEFLNDAMMKEKSFAAQRANVVMVGGSTVVSVQPKTIKEQLEYENIRIPRRPKWDYAMDPDELQRLEREAFIAWRRDLAVYEEASPEKHATPFEKNVEVWKQLWRVAEKAHVVAQIVDARNPLLYYCADLAKLAQELDSRKRCVLVVNKSDYLTREARACWARYFTAQGVDFIFWSAKKESEAQGHETELVRAFAARRANKIEQAVTRRRAERAGRAMAAGAKQQQSQHGKALTPAQARAQALRDSQEKAARKAAQKAAVATSKFSLIADDDSDDEADEEEAAAEQGPEGPEEGVDEEDAEDAAEDEGEDAAEGDDAEEEEEEEEDGEEADEEAGSDLGDDDDAEYDRDYAVAEAEVDVAMADEAEALREHIKARRAAAAAAAPVVAASSKKAERDPLAVVNHQDLTDFFKARAHDEYVAETHARAVAVQRRLAGLPVEVDEDEDEKHLEAAAALDADPDDAAAAAALAATADDADGRDDGSDEYARRRRVRQVTARAAAVRATRGAPKVVVGMLGFPNVGKSSTINALLGAKKVSVAATPGKTKHFQTLHLGDDVVLCDCPGLVFPTFVHSRATLVINGVIPIDTLRDFISPMEAVCQRVSRSQIAQVYGLDLPAWKQLDAYTLLGAHARLRGFFKDHGRPDETRSARLMLKDFVNGKLLHCQCPPGLSKEERRGFYQSFAEELAEAEAEEVREQRRQKEQALAAAAAAAVPGAKRALAPAVAAATSLAAAVAAAGSSSLTGPGASLAAPSAASLAQARELKHLAAQAMYPGAKATGANAAAVAAVREADVEMAFERETEEMLTGGADADEDRDVIAVRVNRAKVTAVAPEVDKRVGANVADRAQAKRDRLAALETQQLSKKQLYRMRNNLHKGKTRGRDVFEDSIAKVGSAGTNASKTYGKVFDAAGNRVRVKDMDD